LPTRTMQKGYAYTFVHTTRERRGALRVKLSRRLIVGAKG
jgi:hypothetical protein